MAFPGGHHEPTDVDLEATARRETFEEIGLSLEGALFIGALPPVRPVSSPKKGLGVFPFVYRLAAPWPALQPNPEVQAIHRFPLTRLLSREGRGSFRYASATYGELTLPCVRLDGTLLWGLTLAMLDTFLPLIEEVRR